VLRWQGIVGKRSGAGAEGWVGILLKCRIFAANASSDRQVAPLNSPRCLDGPVSLNAGLSAPQPPGVPAEPGHEVGAN